jgi:hypothetical protein
MSDNSPSADRSTMANNADGATIPSTEDEKVIDNLDDVRGVISSFNDHCPNCKSSALTPYNTDSGQKVLRCQVCDAIVLLCPNCNTNLLSPYVSFGGKPALRCDKCGIVWRYKSKA